MNEVRRRFKGLETLHVKKAAAADEALRYLLELRTYELGVENDSRPKNQNLARHRTQCRAVYGLRAGKPSVLSVTGVPRSSPAKPPAAVVPAAPIAPAAPNLILADTATDSIPAPTAHPIPTLQTKPAAAPENSEKVALLSLR